MRARNIQKAILFDCGGLGGVAPNTLSTADLVFISHAHADHCGGLFSHARSRFAQAPARYFVPEQSVADLQRARECFEKLDGHALQMDFIGVKPGFRRNLGGGYYVECVATEHRVPSVGYLLFKDVSRIKPEYVGLSREEKAELGKQKMLNERVRELQLSYSGDTTARGLDPRIFAAKLAIVECTFVEDKHASLAVDTQHVLLSELNQVLEEMRDDGKLPHEHVCQLLLVHFSARYNARNIIDAVKHTKLLLGKPTALALAGFSYDPLSKEADVGIQFAV